MSEIQRYSSFKPTPRHCFLSFGRLRLTYDKPPFSPRGWRTHSTLSWNPFAASGALFPQISYAQPMDPPSPTARPAFHFRCLLYHSRPRIEHSRHSRLCVTILAIATRTRWNDNNARHWLKRNPLPKGHIRNISIDFQSSFLQSASISWSPEVFDYIRIFSILISTFANLIYRHLQIWFIFFFSFYLHHIT